jgi:hypothetical protein
VVLNGLSGHARGARDLARRGLASRRQEPKDRFGKPFGIRFQSLAFWHWMVMVPSDTPKCQAILGKGIRSDRQSAKDPSNGSRRASECSYG